MSKLPPDTAKLFERLSTLSKAEQEALIKEFNRQIIRALAKKLDASVKPNKITMQEIVEEVRIVRQKRFEDAKKQK